MSTPCLRCTSCGTTCSTTCSTARTGGVACTPQHLVARVRAVLSDDLLKKQWRDQPRRSNSAGHCYAASEAIFHLLGGKAAGLTPMRIRHEDGPHWYLRTPEGFLDPTSDQFVTPVPHEQGVGCGFLTRDPSRRAAEVIRRVLALPADH